MKKERIAEWFSARAISKTALLLSMIVSLASCGGGNNDPNKLKLEVKPELGELANYLTIENKEAVINLSEFTEDETPYIKISSTLQVKVNEAVASNYSFNFDVVILDKDMNEITDFGDYDIESQYDSDRSGCRNYLSAGNHRAVMETQGPKERWDGKAKAMWEMMRQSGKYLVLKPGYSGAKFVSYSEGAGNKGGDNEEESDEMAIDIADTLIALDTLAISDHVTSSGEDWDKILKEYEAYCTKLASLAKKAQAGDVSAITEYASLLESAQSLETKLNNASSDLSASQAARLAKINAKLASSMM